MGLTKLAEINRLSVQVIEVTNHSVIGDQRELILQHFKL